MPLQQNPAFSSTNHMATLSKPAQQHIYPLNNIQNTTQHKTPTTSPKSELLVDFTSSSSKLGQQPQLCQFQNTASAVVTNKNKVEKEIGLASNTLSFQPLPSHFHHTTAFNSNCFNTTPNNLNKLPNLANSTTINKSPLVPSYFPSDLLSTPVSTPAPALNTLFTTHKQAHNFEHVRDWVTSTAISPVLSSAQLQTAVFPFSTQASLPSYTKQSVEVSLKNNNEKKKATVVQNNVLSIPSFSSNSPSPSVLSQQHLPLLTPTRPVSEIWKHLNQTQ